MTSESESSGAPDGHSALREAAVLIFGLAFAALNGFWTAAVYGLSFGEYPLHIIALLALGGVLTSTGLYLALRSARRIARRAFMRNTP